MAQKYHLISSYTCPWVQRSVKTMRAKGVEFDVTYINLRDKPDWFLEISPHGKVPVLKVDDVPLFESNAIAEYLDEEVAPRLHPQAPIVRALNRAWTDYIPTFSGAVSTAAYATGETTVFYVLTLIAVIVIWLHRENIKRLIAGTEPRVGGSKG